MNYCPECLKGETKTFCPECSSVETTNDIRKEVDIYPSLTPSPPTA